MRIAICDDESSVVEFVHEELIKTLSKLNKKYAIDKYYNGHDLIDNYNFQYDLIFLDIKLKESDGYEVSKLIRKIDNDVIIIFLTSYSNYVFDGYKVNAFRYILKDVFQDEIEKLMMDVTEIIKLPKHRIVLKQKNGDIRIECEDILYISSQLRKITIFTCYEEYKTYGKLSEYENDLLKCKFIRSHQGYLVNSKYIRMLVKDGVLLDNNTYIHISRKRMNETKKKVMEYMR